MFDDPKKSLDELNKALMEAEEVPAEEEDWLQDAKDFLKELDGEPEVPIRNQANNYGRQPEALNFSRTVYADENMDDRDAVFVEKPQRKGAGGLMVLALLELIAIGLIILWWLKWTL